MRNQLSGTMNPENSALLRGKLLQHGNAQALRSFNSGVRAKVSQRQDREDPSQVPRLPRKTDSAVDGAKEARANLRLCP